MDMAAVRLTKEMHLTDRNGMEEKAFLQTTPRSGIKHCKPMTLSPKLYFE